MIGGWGCVALSDFGIRPMPRCDKLAQEGGYFLYFLYIKKRD